VTTGDTAGSAREVAEWGDNSRASLAPELAAEIYGLDILARFVEDEAHNCTRFVILSREPLAGPRPEGPMLTTFVFRVRNVPSALYKALGGFATNGVNMTKLESYMVNGEFAATQFLVDVEGHPDDANLFRALEELRFFSETVTILGAYPAHPFRLQLGHGS
jgi:prephenate dehydratase